MEGRRVMPQPQKKSGGKIALIAASAVLALCLCGFGAACVLAGNDSTIRPNVTVMDLDLGGMTAQEAEQFLQRSQSQLRQTNAVTVTREGGGAARVTLEELDAQMDCTRVAAAAYNVGRGGGVASDGWNYVKTVTGIDKNIVNPNWQSGAEALSAAAARVAQQVDREAVDFSCELGEGCVYITTALDGVKVNQTALAAALKQSLAQAELPEVACPCTTLPAAESTVAALHQQICGAKVEAGYDPETKSVVEGKPGVTFDLAQAQSLVAAAPAGSTVTVPATVEKPAVTAAELEKVLFRDVLGSYSTKVSGTVGRLGNVQLSAKFCNGYILNSGEVFNYFDVVGPCTEARGYAPAPVYIKGKTVDDLGGGICQTVSTLYAATLMANLEIVKRSAHGYVSSYIGKGLDATVSNGGPEFEFANNTPYPIKIVTSYANRKLTVKLLGTKTDDTYVKMVSEVLSQTDFTDEFVETPDLPAGTTKVDQTPYTGYKVQTFRNVYDGNGNLLSSTLESVSNYRARNRITLVGTGPATTPVPAETPAQSNPAEEPVQPLDPPVTAEEPPVPGTEIILPAV